MFNEEDEQYVWKSAALAATTMYNVAGTVKCELPNADVYRFAANMKFGRLSSADIARMHTEAEEAALAVCALLLVVVVLLVLFVRLLLFDHVISGCALCPACYRAR